MGKQKIYIACTSCNYGVKDYWEEFFGTDILGKKFIGTRRVKQCLHSTELDVVPEVGQSIDMNCPNEKCLKPTLVRIEK